MIATSISVGRRALRRSSMALVAVAALTACDNDKAVGPSAAVAPVEASMARLSTATATLTWQVQGGVVGVHPGGSEFTLDNGSGPVTSADSSSLDLDKTPGKFKARVKSGTITVCGKTPPPGYVFYFVPQPTPCVTVTVASGQTIALAPFTIFAEASVYWHAWLEGGWGKGTVYTIESATTGFGMKIADDGPDDLAQNSSLVHMILPDTGLYTVCQIVAPKGGALADPACRDVNVQYGFAALASIFDSKKL